jgi:hypothetical protein
MFFATITVLATLASSVPLWAQCPEDPNDNGICDSLYVEVYPCDTIFGGIEKLVRVPIYVTHDVPDPNIDSIAGFVIPLCYTHTNAAQHCYLPDFYNRLDIYPFPTCYCGIFHDLEGDCGNAPNWMMWLAYPDPSQGRFWDTRILNYDTSHIRLSLVATGTTDQSFWEGSRVLLATYMFSVEDTMTICLDTCFWPPSGRLLFCRSDAVGYQPRHNLPYCFSISYPGRGDCNSDGTVDVGDVVYLINYLYLGDAPPYPVEVGDVNCDGVADIGDVVFLINYLFRSGPATALLRVTNVALLGSQPSGKSKGE